MALDFNPSQNNRIEIGEMFFSRTDERGVIQSGNTVFQRVSGYEWPELINAPHKVVRHPDMPKAVFYIMWKAIQAGKPICAYVCNQTSDGYPYWVLATVFPLKDGYLSVRLKPTADILQKIVPLYNEATDAERKEKLTPEQSAARLTEKILALGYLSYDEFSANALSDELQARQVGMGRAKDASMAAINKTIQSVQKLGTTSEHIQKVFRETHQIPYNMRLQAGRIEGSDGPISVISGNHRQMSLGLESVVKEFREAALTSAELISASAMQIALARVLQEMRDVFIHDPDKQLPAREEILELLTVFSSEYSSESTQSLNKTANNMQKFRKQCRHMRRALSGLELTRIMCKIERFKIDGEHSGLDEIVSRLALAQKALETSCDKIENVVGEILNLTEDLLRDRAKIAA